MEYNYPFGWGELEGIANRTDFDLKQHAQASGKDLSFFDEESKARYVPHVIEPAAGIDRAAMTFLVDGYEEATVKDETRVILHLHPKIAPITVAVFPLVKKEGMPEKAKEIECELRRQFATAIESQPIDRAALRAAGRDRHAVLRDGRRAIHGRRHGDAARTRHATAVALEDRGAHPRDRAEDLGVEAPRIKGSDTFTNFVALPNDTTQPRHPNIPMETDLKTLLAPISKAVAALDLADAKKAETELNRVFPPPRPRSKESAPPPKPPSPPARSAIAARPTCASRAS